MGKEYKVLQVPKCLPMVNYSQRGRSVEVPETSNREIREALIVIAREVTIQANLSMIPRVV